MTGVQLNQQEAWMMFLFPQPRSVENLEGTLVLPVGAADADLVTFFRRVRDGESGIRVEKDAALEREEYRRGADRFL